MLITDQGFRDAVSRAAAQAQRARDERDTCPVELQGCGAKGVLCGVTRRGMTLCKFCPECGWNTLATQEERRAARVLRDFATAYPRERKKRVQTPKKTKKTSTKKKTSGQKKGRK